MNVSLQLAIEAIRQEERDKLKTELAELELLREQKERLMEALEWMIDHDETNYEDGNEYFIAGLERAIEALEFAKK